MALVLVAVLPLALFSIGLSLGASRLDRAGRVAEVQRLGTATAAVIATDIARMTVLIEALARSPALAEANLGAFERHLRAVTAVTGVIFTVGDANGRQVINTAVPPGVAIMAQPRPDLVGRVLASGQPLLTNTIFSPLAKRPVAALVAPIPQAVPGVVLGAAAIAARVDPLDLDRLLPATSQWPGALVAVYDGAGAVFASRSDPGVAVPSLPRDPEKRAQWLGARGSDLAAVAPISGTAWEVVVLAPDAAVASPWRATLWPLVAAGIVATGVAATVALWLGRFLVREAGTVVATAQAIGSDNSRAGARSPVREVHLLQQALRLAAAAARERVAEQARMAGLAEVAAKLETLVAERTRDLEDTAGRLLSAQDEERRRIARELHDSTVQELVAASLHLRALPPPTSKAAQMALADALAAIDRARGELRTVSFLMQPPLLDECGLATAIRSYAEGTATRSGLRIDVTAPDLDPVLPRGVETALFRVLQEALVNVHRHAASRTTRVLLSVDEREARLVVADDGIGLDVAKMGRMGAGIAGMRARIRQLDGDFKIESSATGTTVAVRVPLIAARRAASAA